MAYVFRCLPSDVANRITLLATSSPSAHCFYGVAEDEWTHYVLEAFKRGKIFHADERKARYLQQKRDDILSDMSRQRE